MKIIKYENFLTKSIFIFPLSMVIIGIILISFSCFTVLHDFQQKELDYIRDSLLNEKKSDIKNSVESVNEDIKISMNSLIKREKEEHELDVQTISEVLISIYKNYKGDKEEFIKKVLNTINKIRGRNYFGAFKLSTKKMVVHPIKKLVNKNLEKIIVNGNVPLYKLLIEAVDNPKREGYFDVNFYKPNNKKIFKKIVFVKYVDGLDWVVGTGEYLDEITKVVKDEIIHKILSKKENFYSIIDLENSKLYTNSKVYNLDEVDKEFLSKAKKAKNGGFIVYNSLNTETNKVEKKISYVKFNKDLNIIIESGIYFCKINNFINEQYKKINTTYQKLYDILFFNTILIVVISILISVFISSKLKIIFKKYKTINEEKLKAEYEATHDSLTNAFNRASFNKKFSKELLRAKRYKTPLCIAILDIDHFKKINDTYGHHIGDVVLKKLVEFIQKNIRDSDFFARWGGEEFVLIFPQTKGEDAKLKCEQLKESLKNDKNTQTPATFTFSCGVAEYQEGDTLDDLLQKADKALYSAKETRDRVILST